MSDLSNTGPHPTITSRLLEQLTDMTNLLDQAPAEIFAQDEGWTVLERALDSMETLRAHAELHRPTTSLPLR